MWGPALLPGQRDLPESSPRASREGPDGANLTDYAHSEAESETFGQTRAPATASTLFRRLPHGLLVEADEPLHPVNMLG